MKTLKQVQNCDSAKELNSLLKEKGLRKIKNQKEQTVPYNEFIKDGFKVWVGRNAKANDELTLKYRTKDDLWLHAKDVPGSHVLIKYESGKVVPSTVVEFAAEIAAYYSKRKTDSLAPVIYTPVKFVRKRKGSPAGAVVVEKEKVILVKPKKPF